MDASSLCSTLYHRCLYHTRGSRPQQKLGHTSTREPARCDTYLSTIHNGDIGSPSTFISKCDPLDQKGAFARKEDQVDQVLANDLCPILANSLQVDCLINPQRIPHLMDTGTQLYPTPG
jgi:hypothetical protein